MPKTRLFNKSGPVVSSVTLVLIITEHVHCLPLEHDMFENSGNNGHDRTITSVRTPAMIYTDLFWADGIDGWSRVDSSFRKHLPYIRVIHTLANRVHRVNKCPPPIKLYLGSKLISKDSFYCTTADALKLAPLLMEDELSDRIYVWCKTALLYHHLDPNTEIFDVAGLNALDGDIILSRDNVDSVLSQFYSNPQSKFNNSQHVKENRNSKQRARRKVTSDQSRLWPNAQIPYSFMPSHFDDFEMQIIYTAISAWENNTCLEFEEVKPTDFDSSVLFWRGEGCLSHLGRVSGSQTIVLGDGCFTVGRVAHEIGHALGFYHENSRPDRDLYVTTLIQNLDLKFFPQIFKRRWDEANTYGIPYDYSSLFHSSSTDYTKNSKRTVLANDLEMQGVIGQRESLSFFDVKMANVAYCRDRCGGESLEWSECKNGGYRHPARCGSCVCPRGLAPPKCELPGPGVNANCGDQTLPAIDIKRSLRTPGYDGPTGLQSRAFCSWLITAATLGKRVRLEFTERFEFEGRGDLCLNYAEIRYKDIIRPGPRLCGSDPFKKVFVSHGSRILLSVSTQYVNSWQGFHITYVQESCGGCAVGASADEPECFRTVEYDCSQNVTDCGESCPLPGELTCFREERFCCDGYQLIEDGCVAKDAKTSLEPVTTALTTPTPEALITSDVPLTPGTVARAVSRSDHAVQLDTIAAEAVSTTAVSKTSEAVRTTETFAEPKTFATTTPKPVTAIAATTLELVEATMATKTSESVATADSKQTEIVARTTPGTTIFSPSGVTTTLGIVATVGATIKPDTVTTRKETTTSTPLTTTAQATISLSVATTGAETGATTISESDATTVETTSPETVITKVVNSTSKPAMPIEITKSEPAATTVVTRIHKPLTIKVDAEMSNTITATTSEPVRASPDLVSTKVVSTTPAQETTKVATTTPGRVITRAATTTPGRVTTRVTTTPPERVIKSTATTPPEREKARMSTSIPEPVTTKMDTSTPERATRKVAKSTAERVTTRAATTKPERVTTSAAATTTELSTTRAPSTIRSTRVAKTTTEPVTRASTSTPLRATTKVASITPERVTTRAATTITPERETTKVDTTTPERETTRVATTSPTRVTTRVTTLTPERITTRMASTMNELVSTKAATTTPERVTTIMSTTTNERETAATTAPERATKRRVTTTPERVTTRVATTMPERATKRVATTMNERATTRVATSTPERVTTRVGTTTDEGATTRAATSKPESVKPTTPATSGLINTVLTGSSRIPITTKAETTFDHLTTSTRSTGHQAALAPRSSTVSSTTVKTGSSASKISTTVDQAGTTNKTQNQSKMSRVTTEKLPNTTYLFENVGVWTEWKNWTECSATCGLCGQTFRRRACMAKPCSGAAMEIKNCGSGLCELEKLRWVFPCVTLRSNCTSLQEGEIIPENLKYCLQKSSCTTTTVLTPQCCQGKPVRGECRTSDEHLFT